MTQQPFSNGIVGLVRNSSAGEARALLKQATRLYVSEECHTHSEMVMYEELCTQLLRVTDLRDRVDIATMLAPYPQVPRSVTRALLHDIYPVSSVYIEAAPAFEDVDLLSLIGTAPSSHLELIAARRNLSDNVVEALLNKMRPEALPVLLRNHSIRLPEAAIGHLVDLGRDHRDIALALAERFDDVQDIDLIGLFMMLDGRGRRRVIQALEIAALREFAARRPSPRVPLPDADRIAELARACLSHNSEAMASLLAGLSGIPVPLVAQLLDDKGGEPLAIALKAIGVDAALATRVILFSGSSDTRSYFDVKRLIDLYEMVSLRSAVLLVDHWRGVRHDIPVRPAYATQTEAGTPVRATTPLPRKLPAQEAIPANRRESA